MSHSSRAWRAQSLALAALLAVAACRGVGGPAPRTALPHPVELRLAPYLRVLRTLAVGGEGGVPYLFDTGGGLTVVTPKEAARLGCQPFGRVTGFRANGERLDLGRCGPMVLDLGGLRLSDEAAVLDLMALIGGNAPEVAGLISLQTLSGHAFTLDLAHDRLTIETEASLRDRVRGMQPLIVRSGRQSGGAALDLFVAVATEKGRIWLEIDSGNAGPVQLSPHALEQLGLTPETLAQMVLTFDLPRERMWGARLAPPPG